MIDRARRAIAECQHISTMTEDPGRTTRRFLTPPMQEVHTYLRRRMVALGMDVRTDAAGNLRGLWTAPTAGERRLVLGSHIDTVPNAGAYDGVLGVTIALELVRLAQEDILPLSIEVIAFSEEEGVRFGVPFLGSRAVAGRFDPALLVLKDADGISVEEAIRAFGLDPDAIGEARVDRDAMGFLEVHIEQGPILESERRGLGIVSRIVGQARLSLEFSGQANHAGTTPTAMRRDALAGAAEWIAGVEKFASKTAGLAATVGRITVEPNAANVIPGKTRVSLDVRHALDKERDSAVEALLAKARAIAERRGLTLDCTRQMKEPSVPMDERLTAYLVDAVESAGFPAHTMPSGAGHDAMVMATRLPSAMLFLRSPGGISHHPSENVLEEDVEAALHAIRKFLARLASEASF
jgi:allantoate deiminase